jgi:hypothetical protein
MSHFILVHFAQRHQHAGEALATHRVQEIRLVLAGVDALVQFGAIGALHDAGVVTGGQQFGAQSLGMPQAVAELDLAIAEHIRIGGEAGAVGRKEVREHLPAVLRAEVHAMQRNSEFDGHAPRVLEILGRGAVTLLVLFPVVHEEALHVVAGTLHQQCGHRRIHAARQRDDDAGGHLLAAASAQAVAATGCAVR